MEAGIDVTIHLPEYDAQASHFSRRKATSAGEWIKGLLTKGY
jgi:hypothetical protein